jgi:demethylmenaquinone methyltransferase/2-methoxy-6-polyprenyl-1,4-benzoquinol methylase
LDVGCGTGDVAIKIAESAPHSKIIGMDTSSDMLGIAARKMSRRGLANSIQLKIGNITHIQAAQDSFDGVITSFCIRNVVDRTKALSEMYRVMKPGGKLVILELTDPSGLMRIPFRIYSAVMMPLLTKIMSSVSAYRYLTDSMAAFPSSEDFSSLIASQGFRSVSVKKLTGGISTLFAATK